MTAEAPSAASADESQQSVVAAGERSAGPQQSAGADEGDGDRASSHLPPRTGESPNGNGAHPATAADRAGSDRPTHRPGDAGAPAAEAEATDRPTQGPAEAAVAGGAEEGTGAAGGRSGTAGAEERLARPVEATGAAGGRSASPGTEPEDRTRDGRLDGRRVDHAIDDGTDGGPAVDISGDGAGSGPAGAATVQDLAGRDSRSAANDPWVRRAGEGPGDDNGVVPDEAVAAQVAQRFGAVIGEHSDTDPAGFAAAAVLDVLRASGWADAVEAGELRAESARLRELLAEVIRGHRAREASMAGTETQLLHWLVPLLRAAHGVAFGSLGAKVALRTAVQQVPPDVLATAGLRIDYGIDYGAAPDDEVGPDHEEDR